MQRSTIRLFLINIGVLFLVVSCAPKFSSKFVPAATDRAKVESHYFNGDTGYVYKTNITVYGHELSGILVMKKIAPETHRIVLTTEFGNTLLDVTRSPSEFKVNNIVEELDRKILINTLKKDFSMLLRSEFFVIQAYRDGNRMIYQVESSDEDLYVFPGDEGRIDRLVKASARKPLVTVAYTSENDIFAEKIIIQHHDISLKMEFNNFKNPTE